MLAYPQIVDAQGPPPVAPEVRTVPFRFTGNAKEYFRIWIVNTLLTIVTLGIYSAWAKVRSKQYFYRNTSVDGASFDYVADPYKVLKGRLIAAAALALLFGSQYYSMPLYIAVVVVFVLATPWVVVKSLMFNARNTTYRNIRFAFTGRVGEAFGLYLGMVLLHVVTCGLAYPYVQWRMTSFVVTRHLFGDLRPAWSSKAGEYYRVYLFALLLALPGYAVFFALAFGAAKSGGGASGFQSALFPLLGLFYLYLLLPGAFIKARLANLLYGGISFGPHELSSEQRGMELLKLYVVNLFAVVLSLGLLIPWAKIRLAAYRASCLTLHARGEVRAETLLDDDASALGEGLSDLGDFDIGIGV
jgi:uncharacterized membrane protein YjgN (DUF898 family)